MPYTGNVAWHIRLKDFKGRDTAQYIEAVKAMAGRCAACQLPLGPDAALSLTVAITEGRDLDGVLSRTFDPALCHLRCQDPGLSVYEATDVIGGVAAVGARLLLSPGRSGTTHIPVLAYTLVPRVVMGEPGGEMTSVLVSTLLNYGFQLSFSADYGEILRRAAPVRDTCTCTVTVGGTVQLHGGGALLHSQQLDWSDPADAAWLQAAEAGHVLVISGDSLTITETDLELTAAAHLGTLVSGIVRAV